MTGDLIFNVRLLSQRVQPQGGFEVEIGDAQAVAGLDEGDGRLRTGGRWRPRPAGPSSAPGGRVRRFRRHCGRRRRRRRSTCFRTARWLPSETRAVRTSSFDLAQAGLEVQVGLVGDGHPLAVFAVAVEPVEDRPAHGQAGIPVEVFAGQPGLVGVAVAAGQAEAGEPLRVDSMVAACIGLGPKPEGLTSGRRAWASVMSFSGRPGSPRSRSKQEIGHGAACVGVGPFSRKPSCR